ncbi:MAG: TonB family protein [Bdellovibrionales bacterium]|nr:TonB family protein [Bdellovibrionales bacterium]
MRRENDKSFPFVILSLLLHTSLAFAVTILPSLQPLPEGTTGFTEVEFTALEAPKGQQIKTMDVGKNESEAPSEPITTVPDVKKVEPQKDPEAVVIAPPPAPKITKVNVKKAPKVQKLKMTPVKTETVEESPVPVALPVEENAEEQVSDADFEDDVNKDLEKLDVAGAEALDESLDDKELAKEIEEEDKALAAAAMANNVVDKNIKEDPKEKVAEPAPQVKPAQTAPPALVTGLPNKTEQLRHESNMNYGVPSGTVRDVKDLVQAPGNVPPQYPELSRRRQEMGQVKLEYFVTSEGQVAQMRMTQSSGHAELDNEAMRAIRRYRFQPGQAGLTTHTVNFVLQGKAQATGGTLRTSSNPQNTSSGLRN